LKVSDLWVIHCRIIDFRGDTVPHGEPYPARSHVSGSHAVFISVGPSRLDAGPSERCTYAYYHVLTRTVGELPYLVNQIPASWLKYW
jgi:hypothetical protein